MGNIVLGVHSQFSEARILDEEEPVRLFPPCVDGVPESRESSNERAGTVLTRTKAATVVVASRYIRTQTS